MTSASNDRGKRREDAIRATEHSDRRLWHPRFVGAGAALLIAVFVSDTIYARTLLFQWNNFSAWLLVAGLAAAACAGVALLVDLATRRIGALSWPRFLGLSAAALLSVLNALVHSRDAYTAVVPQGIALSAATAAILAFVGLSGWTLEARAEDRRAQDLNL